MSCMYARLRRREKKTNKYCSFKMMNLSHGEKKHFTFRDVIERLYVEHIKNDA